MLSPLHPLIRGFDDVYFAPHSRNSEIKQRDIDNYSELVTLAASPLAGVAIVAHKSGRQFFLTGHQEYDRDTLKNEYLRDVGRGLCPGVPSIYFKEGDDKAVPVVSWRAHANLLFTNWLNYYVYQQHNLSDC